MYKYLDLFTLNRKSRRISAILIAMLIITGACSAAPTETAAIAPPTAVLQNAIGEPPQPAQENIAPQDAPDNAYPDHPLSIAYLRAQEYPGSDFVFEETLENGSNYHRYIVSYRSEGLKIYALLTVPFAEKPPTGYPVVLLNQCYITPAQYRTTERYVAYVDAFASNGYLVVRPDYRGHGFSEGEPASPYRDPDYTIDVLNALASVRRYPDADNDRIGMWGHSMGGYITLRAMVTDPDIRAGVIWAGVVASYTEMLDSWFGRWSGGRRSNWVSDMVDQYGDPNTNPAFWNAISANHYLTDISGPVQIHHGTNDLDVPYEYANQLTEQLRAIGKAPETMIYDGDDHNISTNRDNALILSVAFFHRYVRDR